MAKLLCMSSYDLILKNGTLVTPSGLHKTDISFLGSKIAKIGASENINRHTTKGGASSENINRHTTSPEIIKDCTGLFILPGAIDMHVHFRDPGSPEKEDFATGGVAALAGGITTVVDMPNTSPPTITAEAFKEKQKLAAQKSLVHTYLYMGFTGDNIEEIKKVKDKIAGVKVYLGSSMGDLLLKDHAKLEELFKLGVFVIVHAEDEVIIQKNIVQYKNEQDPAIHSVIRSRAAAYEGTKFVLHLAKKHDARVHITHVTTKEEIEELRKFMPRSAGKAASDIAGQHSKITADVTPHHLFLTEAAYAQQGNFVKVNPPLRTKEDCETLWEALRDGTVQVVATDHAPHTKAEKMLDYWHAPAGVPGVETMLPLLLDAVNHGMCSLEDVSKFISANPARILGLSHKGRLEEGLDADVTVIDMEQERVVGAGGYKTKCGWSPFEGRKLKGWPVMTVVGGKVAN